MNYLKKLPERPKDPETCCGSVKEGNKYVNPVRLLFNRNKYDSCQ